MFRTFKFRPLERQTLELLVNTHQQEGDPVDTYSRLMSAAMVAAAILDLSPKDVAEHARIFSTEAQRAVQDRRDIFGGVLHG